MLVGYSCHAIKELKTRSWSTHRQTQSYRIQEEVYAAVNPIYMSMKPIVVTQQIVKMDQEDESVLDRLKDVRT